MSDDDTIIIRNKAQRAAKAVKDVLSKSVPSVQRWHLVAIAVVAFVLGVGVAA